MVDNLGYKLSQKNSVRWITDNFIVYTILVIHIFSHIIHNLILDPDNFTTMTSVSTLGKTYPPPNLS